MLTVLEQSLLDWLNRIIIYSKICVKTKSPMQMHWALFII